MSSPRSTPRGEKRPLILGAATELLAERGFAAVTVAEIADRAGIGKGTVYEYFSSKDELLFAVFEWLNEENLERARKLQHAEGTSRDRLARMLQLGAEMTRDHVEMQPVVLDFWAASRGTGIEKRYNQATVETYRAFRTLVADVIRDGQTAGEIDPGTDPEAVAVMLVSAFDGLGVQYFFDRELDPAAITESFGELILAGLEARS
ncbi:MAG: TetR/AcrR family transcriptional regulator [Thermoanaerobaculales bacterium]|jgi:TetR/AcrR family fatty acid metabolism transcriptional regulator|nr:TetR/AcrR family transcriptional regulator [Thermoanaerobaculales bacterium]